MTKSDGGPAFPRAPFTYADERALTWDVKEQHGMTLRDWFASQAMVGILSGGFADTVPHDDVGGGSDLAYFAYQYADAMIAERQKGGEES